MTLEVVLKPNNDYIEHPNEKMLASKIVKGDMLMCLSSQSDNPEPLGKTAIYEFDTFALLNQRVLKFRPYDDKLTRYLFYTINSFYFWYNVSHQSGGSAQANLKLNHVLEMLIPLPPLAEQHRIVAKIEELMPKVEEYGKAQEALDKLNAELPERLKKSILQEAITGRLVPQDPNDEPASVLLDKIRAEKKRLVKEGKLKKKDLVETPISEDEIPFEIPESWEWVRLNSLFNIFTGKKDANYGDANGNYVFFTCSNTPIKSPTYSYDGDYLIMPGNGANIGQVIHYKGKFEAYQRTYLLQAFGALCYEYIKYHLMSNWKEYNQDKMYGSAIPYIKLGNLTSYLVALPPLAEQHRIVAKIEKLMKEIDKMKM